MQGLCAHAHSRVSSHSSRSSPRQWGAGKTSEQYWLWSLTVLAPSCRYDDREQREPFSRIENQPFAPFEPQVAGPLRRRRHHRRRHLPMRMRRGVSCWGVARRSGLKILERVQDSGDPDLYRLKHHGRVLNLMNTHQRSWRRVLLKILATSSGVEGRRCHRHYN